MDDSANVYVTGYNFTLVNHDYATLKYSTSGEEKWIIRYNGVMNADDGATAIALDAIGNVYVTGITNSAPGLYAPRLDSLSDIVTVKYLQVAVSPLSVSITSTDISCNGAEDGSAEVIVSGGIFPYTYLWNNGQTTDSIAGLSSGDYTVTVTDGLNSSITEIVTINQPPLDTVYTSAACSELFISEYVEGSTHNTALEIYNPTDSIGEFYNLNHCYSNNYMYICV